MPWVEDSWRLTQLRVDHDERAGRLHEPGSGLLITQPLSAHHV
jgi:hypothetical protein